MADRAQEIFRIHNAQITGSCCSTANGIGRRTGKCYNTASIDSFPAWAPARRPLVGEGPRPFPPRRRTGRTGLGRSLVIAFSRPPTNPVCSRASGISDLGVADSEVFLSPGNRSAAGAGGTWVILPSNRSLFLQFPVFHQHFETMTTGHIIRLNTFFSHQWPWLKPDGTLSGFKKVERITAPRVIFERLLSS